MLTETAQRADREQDKALVLQRGILPPKLPRLPRTEMAVRYVPAAAGMEVGGDWYDVIRLRDGFVGSRSATCWATTSRRQPARHRPGVRCGPMPPKGTLRPRLWRD
jgi:hypothetical protein